MPPIFAVLVALFPILTLADLGHGHNHVHGDVHGRALDAEVTVVTKTTYTTVTMFSTSSATILSQPSTVKLSSKGTPYTVASTASSTVAPAPKPSNPLGSPYAALVPQPSKAVIVNSCTYEVYVSSIGNESCGPGNISHLVLANTIYSEPIRSCYKSGVSLKVAKTKDLTKPMQFEYTVWDDKKTVSYDISYLDCMVDHNGSKDFSQCVGHERGIQAAAGEYCPVFQCLADVECAQNAYTVPEFGYLPGAPVGACGVEKGIAFELCAANRG